ELAVAPAAAGGGLVERRRVGGALGPVGGPVAEGPHRLLLRGLLAAARRGAAGRLDPAAAPAARRGARAGGDFLMRSLKFGEFMARSRNVRSRSCTHAATRGHSFSWAARPVDRPMWPPGSRTTSWSVEPASADSASDDSGGVM